MELFQRDFVVFHHRAFGDFQFQHGRGQAGFMQHLGNLLVEVAVAKQATGNIHRHKRQRPPAGLPLHHLRTGLTQHPGVDIGD
ncbi:hypothetical protein D3C77_776070 [compost metagenome]